MNKYLILAVLALVVHVTQSQELEALKLPKDQFDSWINSNREPLLKM
jgi:hypothetical protein